MGSETAAAAPQRSSPLRTILLGTGTNYLRVFVRLAGGIFTFRLLFKSLSQEDFGFYQLMWSTIGYVVLLDFGFGASVQRAMAIGLDRDDEATRQERREIVSTVFWSYAALDLVLGALLFFCGDALLKLLHFDPGASSAHYHQIAIIFAIGLILGFPTGIYREAVRGLNLLHVINLIDTGFAALQAIAIIVGCLRGWSLTLITGLAVGLLLSANWTTAALAMRHADLRPRLRHVRASRLRGLSAFSVYSYLITMTGMLMSQCDQVVIGAVVSVEAVARYVPGVKLGSVYWSLATQMQETIGPVAARLGGILDPRARLEALQRLLIASQRWSTMISALLIIPLLVDMRGSLALITGERAAPPDMLHTGYLTAINAVTGAVILYCPKRILMMVGHHRALVGFSVAEGLINLGFSLYFCWRWQTCTGAAAGTLIASLLVSMFWIPIYSCRALELPIGTLLREGFGRGLAANLGALGLTLLWTWAAPPMPPTARFLIGCALCGLAGLAGWWKLGMFAEEKDRARQLWQQLRARRAAGETFPRQAAG